MQLCIFEDHKCDQFAPLTLSRPVYELVSGFYTIKERILRSFRGMDYTLHCRPYLKNVLMERNPGTPVNEINQDECILINGRIVNPVDLKEFIDLSRKKSGSVGKTKSNRVFVCNETIVAVRLSGDTLTKFKSKLDEPISLQHFEGVPVEKVNVKTYDYIWNMIFNNGEMLKIDFSKHAKKLSSKEKLKSKLYAGVHIIEKKNIFIGKNVVIKPGTVLDASPGPIYIDDAAEISSNAVIEGPVYIGKKVKVKAMTYIYDNVSIGEVSKVGGEIEETIIMPYSNKPHWGFIGHAYLGSWINLGADTNCSDLKNNYSNVKANFGDKVVDSGSKFLGLIMGDHSKSGINTMFNTGTTVGFSCNIFGSGFPDKFIPSFSWGGKEGITSYKVEKSLQTAKKVMERRNKVLSKEEEILFNRIYEMTIAERAKKGY
jgi:UDP-N-acetylglucosamine diphosphorylase/glucosamine-1-phosphate N-acetyltransferase